MTISRSKGLIINYVLGAGHAQLKMKESDTFCLARDSSDLFPTNYIHSESQKLLNNCSSILFQKQLLMSKSTSLGVHNVNSK